jgi:hypothetical protein
MSKVVTFLKQAGVILANIGAAEAGLEPIFKAALPATAGATVDKLDLMFKSIVATEGQFSAAFPGQQTGPQKLIAAASLVGPVLSTVDTIRGKSIANEKAYSDAVKTITGGIADLMNALEAKTAGKDDVLKVIPTPGDAISQSAASAGKPGA